MSGPTPGRNQTSDAPDVDYLLAIERLARAVVEQASRDGSLIWALGEDAGQPALQRSIDALARNLPLTHVEDDGCLDHR